MKRVRFLELVCISCALLWGCSDDSTISGNDEPDETQDDVKPTDPKDPKDPKDPTDPKPMPEEPKTPKCGDGNVDEGEACDPGDSPNAYGLDVNGNQLCTLNYTISAKCRERAV